MSIGITEGLRFLSSNGTGEPHSPTSDELSGSPNNRGSSSPGYDSNPERPVTRKRTNTTSSGNGEKRTANKICRVCGDKAFSYNFNVITCESCKAFFRRNANKEKEIRCPFVENCEINVVSRRFCQRCRLAKCFDVGMKKEWIMTEEARLEKKQRVEENRERRREDKNNSESKEKSPSEERERVKSESRSDDSNHGITVREYVMQNDDIYKRMSAQAAESSHASMPQPEAILEPQLVIPSQLELEQQQQSAQLLATMAPACNSHSFMDSVPTTAANSLADVSSTTSLVVNMDIDPSTTMSSNGFIPPTIEAAMSVGILPVSVANAMETSLMQAQLTAAQVQQVQQVQAAINHHNQQQQIAAVVAAHIGEALAPTPMPLMPTLAQALPTALPTLSAPMMPMAATLAAQAPALLHGLPSLNNQEMVTIRRDVLVQLLETNNALMNAKCSCTCLCGRYPPGANIVDQVTKDLLAAENQSNSTNCTSCENKEEPARLETAEDFQMQGLLPSEDSSIQWLNSSQPTVVDPSNFPLQDIPSTFSLTMDSLFAGQAILESQMRSISVDPDIALMSSADRSLLCELESANQNQQWNENFNSDGAEKYAHYFRQDLAACGLKGASNTIESALRGVLNVAGRLAGFRKLNQADQVQLLKNRALPYMIIRGAQLFDPKENQWTGNDSWPFGQDMLHQCIRLYSLLSDDVRSNESMVTVLSLLALIDPDADVRDKDAVCRQRDKLSGLLKRLLYTQKQDSSRTRIEFRNLMGLLNTVRDLSARASIADWDPRKIEAVLSEMC